MGKKFTWDEVKRHNKESDCWIVVKGKVYDVTAFLEEHPGGAEVLLDQGGKDATFPFEDVGHSEGAINDLKALEIGDLDESAVERPSGAGDDSQAKGKGKKASGGTWGMRWGCGAYGVLTGWTCGQT